MRVAWFFEDSLRSRIPQLFQVAYRDTSHFIYSNSASALPELVEEFLQFQDSLAVVFLDSVPGNSCIYRDYNKLRKLSILSEYRVIVLPIVCAEYYYLKSLYGRSVVKDAYLVSSCLSKDWSFYILWARESKRSTLPSYEAYCKWLCRHALYPCAAIYYKQREDAHVYTSSGCECLDCTCAMSPYGVFQKALDLLRAYPVIPVPFASIVFPDRLWKMHRRLVEEYNTWSQNFANASNGTCTCFRFEPIL